MTEISNNFKLNYSKMKSDVNIYTIYNLMLCDKRKFQSFSIFIGTDGCMDGCMDEWMDR